MLDIFCNRQLKVISVFNDLKLIEVTKCIDYYDTITSNFECKRLEIMVNPLFERALHLLIHKSLDPDGKKSIQNLINHHKVLTRTIS
jgi:hypothetical protein